MPTTTASTTCCCLTCCYVTDTCDSSTVTRRIMCSKPKTFSTSSSSSSLSSSSSDSRDPPSEAAAFVASASAAAFILLVALLAVVLSSVAVLAVASAVPVADAAADVRPGTQTAADCPHRWHNQQRHRPNRLSVQQQQQRVTSRHVDDDIPRQKRQLFRKNVNREPGIIGLTFSLIGGVSAKLINIRTHYYRRADPDWPLALLSSWTRCGPRTIFSRLGNEIIGLVNWKTSENKLRILNTNRCI